MGGVLLVGAAVAVAGFLTGAFILGLSMALCFLIWIVGALMVNRWKYPSSMADLAHHGRHAAPERFPER